MNIIEFDFYTKIKLTKFLAPHVTIIGNIGKTELMYVLSKQLENLHIPVKTKNNRHLYKEWQIFYKIFKQVWTN